MWAFAEGVFMRTLIVCSVPVDSGSSGASTEVAPIADGAEFPHIKNLGGVRIVSRGEGILKDTPEMQHVRVTAAGRPHCRVVHGLIGSSSSRKRAVRQATLHLLPTFPQIGRCPRSYLRLAVVYFFY